MAKTKAEMAEFQRAAIVAQNVELVDITLSGTEATLLVNRGTALNTKDWRFSFDQSSDFKLNLDNDVLHVRNALGGFITATEKSKVGVEIQVVKFGCSFDLTYVVNQMDRPTGKELDDFLTSFAKINSMFNAWPYFREILQSTTVRMGLVPFTLPLYRLSDKHRSVEQHFSRTLKRRSTQKRSASARRSSDSAKDGGQLRGGVHRFRIQDQPQ